MKAIRKVKVDKRYRNMNFNVSFFNYFLEIKPIRIERKMFVLAFSPKISQNFVFVFLQNWLPEIEEKDKNKIAKMLAEMLLFISRHLKMQNSSATCETRGPFCENMGMKNISGKFSRKYLFWRNFV
jgi:hypothetical protein